LTADGCSVQAQDSECLDVPHTSCCVPWLGHLQPRKLSALAHSGFEPDLPVTPLLNVVKSIVRQTKVSERKNE